RRAPAAAGRRRARRRGMGPGGAGHRNARAQASRPLPRSAEPGATPREDDDAARAGRAGGAAAGGGVAVRSRSIGPRDRTVAAPAHVEQPGFGARDRARVRGGEKYHVADLVLPTAEGRAARMRIWACGARSVMAVVEQHVADGETGLPRR